KLSNMDHQEEALATFDAMLQHNKTPPFLTFIPAFKICSKLKRSDRALAYLDQLREIEVSRDRWTRFKPITTNPSTFIKVIDACFSAKDKERCLQVLERADTLCLRIQPSIVLSVLDTAIVERDLFDPSLHLWRRMRARGEQVPYRISAFILRRLVEEID